MRLGGVALFFTIVLCTLSYRWVMELRPLFDQLLAGPLKPQEAFQTIGTLLLYRLIGITVIMFVLFIGLGIFLSHRLTGPIWKLERDLTEFFNGAPITDLKFRKSDEFQKLPALVNKLIKGYTGPRG